MIDGCLLLGSKSLVNFVGFQGVLTNEPDELEYAFDGSR